MLKGRLKSGSSKGTNSQCQETSTSDSQSPIRSETSKSKPKTRPLAADHSPSKKDYNGPVARDGTPIISSSAADHFRPSDVCHHSTRLDKMNSYKASKSGKIKGRQVLLEPPTAKESAFSGPPRYDWIDIETAAAVKIQSVVRRNRVMDGLTSQNISTAAMRNRVRSKTRRRQKTMVSEDVPGIFSFCGIGFLFGDATGEDQEVLNSHDKVKLQQKKVKKTLEEEKKRKLRLRKKASENVCESVEVVDDLSRIR